MPELSTSWVSRKARSARTYSVLLGDTLRRPGTARVPKSSADATAETIGMPRAPSSLAVSSVPAKLEPSPTTATTGCSASSSSRIRPTSSGS